jgi:NTE family protein
MVTNPDSKRLALVVGAGAVKCAAALGLWRSLKREGIQIDLYVGCSGGSLYTTSMALGYDVEETIAITRRLWDRQVTSKRNGRSVFQVLLPGLFGFDERFALYDDAPLLGRLRSVFGQRTFADLQTPLYIVATDFHSADQVVISDGYLLDALRASVSIPYIWPAWQVNGRLLMDGSLSNPMPVDLAIREGAQVILAMGFESPYPRRVKSLSRFAFHINSMMTNNLFQSNFAFHNLAHYAEIIPVIPDFEEEITLFDTDKISYVISQGEKAMDEQLPYLQQLLATLEEA